MQTNITTAQAGADSPIKQKRSASLFKKPRPFEVFIQGLLFLCGAASILTTLGIVITLGSEASHFFTNWGLINTNKTLTEVITAEATTLHMNEGGLEFKVGDVVDIEDELMLVIEVPAKDSILVERGFDNTLPVEHAAKATLYIAKRVTLTEFLTGTKWQPQIGNFGIWPLLNSTLLISFIGMLVAIPVGLGTAVYLSEYAAPQVRQTLKPLLEILAGVPTVVFGYFALTFVTPALRGWFDPASSGQENVLYAGVCLLLAVGSIYASQRAAPAQQRYLTIASTLLILAGMFFAVRYIPAILQTVFNIKDIGVYNMASAGLVIGILIIPTISTISEDAMRAVPRALREASYGLGATRYETVVKVIIPSALSGILAAVLLGISRAVGETMVVAIAAGAGPNFTFNPFEAAETITGHIARISTGDLSYNSMDYNSLFALGLALFVITLLMNIVSNVVTRRFREVYQ